MTLPGGPADKLGNRYEKWWTLSEFVRLLHGDTEAIRIEDPGVEKAEFVVTSGSRRELHQVKRSHPNGKWSLAALRNDGFLRAIGSWQATTTGSSSHRAATPASFPSCARRRETRSRRRSSSTPFWRPGSARDGSRGCGATACDVPAAVDRLRRIDVRTIDERGLERTVRWGVQTLFAADSNTVVAKLRVIVDDSMHRTITRQALVEALALRGYRLRDLTTPENAGVAVEAATDTYLDGARGKLIRRRLIPRTAAASCPSPHRKS